MLVGKSKFQELTNPTATLGAGSIMKDYSNSSSWRRVDSSRQNLYISMLNFDFSQQTFHPSRWSSACDIWQRMVNISFRHNNSLANIRFQGLGPIVPTRSLLTFLRHGTIIQLALTWDMMHPCLRQMYSTVKSRLTVTGPLVHQTDPMKKVKCIYATFATRNRYYPFILFLSASM